MNGNEVHQVTMALRAVESVRSHIYCHSKLPLWKWRARRQQRAMIASMNYEVGIRLSTLLATHTRRP